MSQQHVEIVIGRLLTDAAFRRAFLQWPLRILGALQQVGLEFSDAEIAALVGTDRRLWPSMADRLDPRLQQDRPTWEDEAVGASVTQTPAMD
jgi:hypothetical protein